MHRKQFGWGSATDPAGVAYSAVPDSLAGFKGPTSKERGEGLKTGGERRMGEGMGAAERKGGRRGQGKGGRES